MDEHRHSDPIEQQLVELDAAERAGVFRRSAMSEAAFRAAVARPAPWLTGARRWGAVAAAIVVVAGVWTWIASIELAAVRRGARSGSPVALVIQRDCRDQAILNCIGGPTRFAMSDCGRHDYDGDGDVDLADFGNFQRRCNGVTQ